MTGVYPWRKILVPTDFSTASRWAYDHALEAASTTDAELVVLHVRLLNPSKPGELRFPADPSVYDYVEQQELSVLRAHAAKQKPDVRLRLQVRKGVKASDEILACATEENTDLVILATHTKHVIAHLIIGSTTVSVLGGCRVPVLVIRYGVEPTEIRRIAVPWTKGSPATLEYAATIARHHGGDLTLLAIAERQSLAPHLEEARNAAAQLPDVNVTAVGLEAKTPEKELLRFASAKKIDLLAISPGCTPGGTVAESTEWIVRHAMMPVLVVS